MDSIRIRPVAATDLRDATSLLATLNSETTLEILAERIQTILAEHPHYQLIGAYAGDKLVGVAGAWIATKIWCGRYLEIDNLVVDPTQRSSGIGSLLIRHLETIAHDNNCCIILLGSYTGNRPSHRLYHRLGYEIWGFHFVKPIGDWKGNESP